MQEWYSAEEIATIKNLSVRHIQRVLKLCNCNFRKREGRLQEYHISNLPEDIKESIIMADKIEESRDNITAKEDRLAFISSISDSDLNRAEAKESIVKAFIQFLMDTKVSKTKAKDLFCEKYNNKELLNEPLIPFISVKTLYNWEKAYKKDGIKSLTDSYGSRKGQTIIDSNEDIKNFILAMIYEHPHTNCKLIMRGLRGRFSRAELPSYRTVQNWVANWKAENQSCLLNIKSPDRWRNKYLSATGSYSENIKRLNQLWEFDSTPTDILLNDGKRHNIVGVIDIYSRRVKFLVSRTSNSQAVSTIIRNAILDWGVPERVKTDNGADYASKHIKRVFETLEVEQTFCPPFTPQAKPHIERVFKTFSHDLVELLPGYIGHNVAERKDIESRKSFADHIMGNAKQVMNLNLSVEDLQEFCDRWIDAVYMHQMHGGLNNKTPFEMVSQYKGEILKIQNERALDILLSETSGDGLRIVTKKGIAIDGSSYDSSFLAGYEGKQVKVLYDESNFAEIYVFTLDGQFICKAICPERKGISRKEVAVAKQRLQKQLISESKQALKKLAKEYSTKDIAQEILNKRVSETENVVFMPKVVTEYKSKFLAEAENVIKKPNRTARSLTAEEKAVMDRLEEGKQSKVVELPASPRQKYHRWLDIDAKLRNGERVIPEDITFWTNFQKSTTYKAEADLYEQNARSS